MRPILTTQFLALSLLTACQGSETSSNILEQHITDLQTQINAQNEQIREQIERINSLESLTRKQNDQINTLNKQLNIESNTADSNNDLEDATDTAPSETITDNSEQLADNQQNPDPSPARTPNAIPAPLTPEQRQIIQNITWDEEPEVLYAVESVNIGRHYLVSDEKHPELFKPSIENLGGTYIGVGTDQGYLYVGWQRPEFGILIDYDPMVVEIHQFILKFISLCDNSQCLKSYFSNASKGEEWLESEDCKQAGMNTPHMAKRYKRLRGSVLKSLRKLEDSTEKTMMNDDETYQYIRGLVNAGRLITVRANLLGDQSMKSISDGLRALNAKVTTLYLSNAEQYWNYSNEFKQNMLSLPFSDHGLIMRTRASYPKNGDYRYSIQPAHVFNSWMSKKRCKNVKQMLIKTHIHNDEFPFVVDDIMPSDTLN